MARTRNVDTLRGTGRVLADDQPQVLVQEVGYVVIVQQEVVEASPAAGAHDRVGTLSARGYLVHDHFKPHVAEALIGKKVDLELSDGRRWPCMVQDSDGGLVGRQGFRPPLTPDQRALGLRPGAPGRQES